jgi:hypothetical protein
MRRTLLFTPVLAAAVGCFPPPDRPAGPGRGSPTGLAPTPAPEWRPAGGAPAPAVQTRRTFADVKELETLLMGKTQEEVIAILGKPHQARNRPRPGAVPPAPPMPPPPPAPRVGPPFSGGQPATNFPGPPETWRYPNPCLTWRIEDPLTGLGPHDIFLRFSDSRKVFIVSDDPVYWDGW